MKKTTKKTMAITKRLLSGKFSSVSNMRSSAGNDVPNQFIVYTDRSRIFQSYSSVICVVGNGVTILGRDYDYSNTTMKYLSAFLGHGVAETRARIDSGEYLFNDNLR
jgi:hypothetical protein